FLIGALPQCIVACSHGHDTFFLGWAFPSVFRTLGFGPVAYAHPQSTLSVRPYGGNPKFQRYEICIWQQDDPRIEKGQVPVHGPGPKLAHGLGQAGFVHGLKTWVTLGTADQTHHFCAFLWWGEPYGM